MSPFSLHQLRIFIAVADRENLTAAGRALRLSPATISEALRNLESTLHQPLFDRANKRLRLNSSGRAFLKDARILLSQSDALYRHHMGRSRLLCGASVTVGNYILPPFLIALMHEHPDIHVDLVIRNSEGIAELVINREIQAAVVEGKIASPHLECIAWQEDELAIIASPDHPLAQGATHEQLADTRWILRETGSGTRESFDEAAESWPAPPQVVMTAGGNEFIKRAVAAGHALGCLSLAAVRTEIDRGELILIPPPCRMVRTLTFVRRHDFIEDTSLAIFIKALGL